MKALVVYDSKFGNTERVAKAVAEAIGTRYLDVDDARGVDIDGLDLLVVGSPTQGGRPTKETQQFLKDLPTLRGTRVAAFDTRIDAQQSGFFLRALIGLIGYAAPKIDSALRSKGGLTAAQPLGCYVTGNEGPLADNELARAADWGAKLAGLAVAVSA